MKFNPLATKPGPAKQLLEQGIGARKGYLAKSGIPVIDDESFVHEAFYAVVGAIDKRDMSTEVRRRVLELGISPTLSEEDAA